MPVVPRLQQKSVCFWIHDASRLGHAELELQLLRNEPGDLVLHGEDVLQITIE
jgi:hypothetical protein